MWIVQHDTSVGQRNIWVPDRNRTHDPVCHCMKSTDNILRKPIENKLNIQTSSYARHGRCSGHEVDVHQSRGEESQIKGELLLITVV